MEFKQIGQKKKTDFVKGNLFKMRIFDPPATQPETFSKWNWRKVFAHTAQLLLFFPHKPV